MKSMCYKVAVLAVAMSCVVSTGVASAMDADVEHNIKVHGLTLPHPTHSNDKFVPYVVSGNMVYISGQLPADSKSMAKYQAQLGAKYSIEQGQEAAKLSALNVVAQLKHACLGDLNRVKRVVKLTIFVNSENSFTDQPKVANAASEVMIAAFGKAKGAHARSAIGVSQLPLGSAVEVEAVFELYPQSLDDVD